MKTPQFWQRKGLASLILWPLSMLYQGAANLRRLLPNDQTAALPVVCIGNAVVGGAGKTPLTLWLAKSLQAKGKTVHIIGKGYGGRHHKPTQVNTLFHNAHDVGDEALLHQQQAPTWIGQNRAQTAVAANRSHPDLILSDDGLQNPHLPKQYSLLVIDGHYGLGNNRVMPAGPLREPFTSALQRVDAVVIIGADKHNLTPLIKLKRSIPVYHAETHVTLPANLQHSPLIAFAGLGRPEKFKNSLIEAKADVKHFFGFADHHTYTEAELKHLWAESTKAGARLVTTEKDYVRLPAKWQKRITAIPLTFHFNPASSGAELCSRIISSVLDDKRS